MSFYRLNDDLYIKNRWILDEIYSPDSEIDFWEYNSVGPISLPDSRLAIDISHEGERLDITFAAFDVLIANIKAELLFKKEEVELLPISIGDLPNEEFYVINILNEIDCIDRERSDFTLWEIDDPVRPDLAGEYSSFFKMVVDPAALAGYDIVRVKGFNNAIIVSDALKMKIGGLGLSGVAFESV